jgi:hypothetical protein
MLRSYFGLGWSLASEAPVGASAACVATFGGALASSGCLAWSYRWRFAA